MQNVNKTTPTYLQYRTPSTTASKRRWTAADNARDANHTETSHTHHKKKTSLGPKQTSQVTEPREATTKILIRKKGVKKPRNSRLLFLCPSSPKITVWARAWASNGRLRLGRLLCSYGWNNGVKVPRLVRLIPGLTSQYRKVNNLP